jgi:hypothetical protein
MAFIIMHQLPVVAIFEKFVLRRLIPGFECKPNVLMILFTSKESLKVRK